MDSDSRSHGLWEASAPAAPSTYPLSSDLRADVAIIGGGYTGLSAALHLAEAGKTAVVLEANDIGFGGSGRNVGLVNAGLWITPEQVTRALGQVYAERLLDRLGNAPRLVFDIVKRFDIACEATRTGTLHCAVGRKGLANLESRCAQWHARNAPVELIDARTTAAKVGTSAYAGALLDHRAGTIQPLAYVRGLAAAAQSQGATILTNSPALALESLGEGWRVRTPGGSVSAGWVIVATNAYSHGPWASLGEEMIKFPYFNMATEPLPKEILESILPERQGVWDTPLVLSSFRLDQTGRLVFGSVGALRGIGLAVHRQWSHRALGRLFPRLRPIRFEYEWFGWIGMTKDAVPRCHLLDRNIVSMSGYNGRGIAPGTAFGRELALLASGTVKEGELALPVVPFSRVRLRRLKQSFCEIGAQAVHLASARI
jgi:glycine/D-amino acid oxidase-like deaminating enzyme